MTEPAACGQVAQAALQVWAHGSHMAEVMADVSAQERSHLETALKDTLLPHLSKMGLHASQVRHRLHCQPACFRGYKLDRPFNIAEVCTAGVANQL